VKAFHVDAFAKELQGKFSLPTVKRYPAELRVRFDWLVTGYPFGETVPAALRLRAGRRVFAIDSLPDDESRAVDHPVKQPDDLYEIRKLNDGRVYRVVKVYYRPAKLEAALNTHGFAARVKTTGRFFWCATGERRPDAD
jgi:hypothetical protein